MKIAITIWETRISPVFDSARTLLVVDTQGDEIESERVSFDARQFNRFLLLLRELEVQVLICGALCEGSAKILEAHGIEVLSFLAGEAKQVLECYLQGRDLAAFSLPGCRWGICRQRRKSRWKTNRLMREDALCVDLDNEVRKAKDSLDKGEDAVA